MIEEEGRLLGRGLPRDLRDHLRVANGGEIRCSTPGWDEVWELYPVWDPTDRRTIARSTGHIATETQRLHRDLPGVFPSDAIAVGANGGGDPPQGSHRNRPTTLSDSA